MARRVVLAILLAVFGGVIFSTKASALDISSTYTSSLSGANVRFYYQNAYSTVSMTPAYHSNNLRFYRYNGTTTLNTTIREINFTTAASPNSPSIAHFALRISKEGNDVPLGFEGFSSQANSILARNCINIEDTDTTNGSMVSFWQCDYWVYTDGYGYFQLLGDVFYSPGSRFYLDVLGQVDYAVLSAPISSSTITNVGNQITQAINDLEVTVESSGGSATPAQIQNAAQTAIENALADEKQEYEEQAQDNEQSINSDSSAAQSTATTLLSVVGQFISTLTSAQPTNCNLDGSLIPHLNLGTLNLCSFQMPTALTVLGSLVLIAFVVPLAYHTVKRMLALIGSFQN